MSRTNSRAMAPGSLSAWTLILLSVCVILSLAPCPDMDFCQPADSDDADDLAINPAVPRALVAVLILDLPKIACLTRPIPLFSPIAHPPTA